MAEDQSGVVRVKIFGEYYSIRSKANPEYTHRVAEHIDQAMQNVKKQIGLQEPLKIAILASMSITDELFQSNESTDKKSEELSLRFNSIIDLIDNYLDSDQAKEVLSG